MTEPSPVTDEYLQMAFLVENNPDGIALISRDRRIEYLNSTMESMTGWNRGEAIGRACHEILPLTNEQGDTICETDCPITESRSGVLHRQATIISRDGHPIDVVASYSIPVRDGGEPGPVVLSLRDIVQVGQIDSLRSSLLAMISHELQTPIAIIKAYASTLARPDARWSRETIREKLQTIESESDRLSLTVSKLLYASRLESDAMTLNITPLDMRATVNDLINRLSSLTGSHRIETDFPPDFPPVPADPERIEEVLHNLLENAIKFSPNGGCIRVTGNILPGQVLISVADEGIGIMPQEGERLFDQFYRSPESTAGYVRGTGLGLYICRTLIEAHGGRISVEGEPGQGACFTFSLPLSEEGKDSHD